MGPASSTALLPPAGARRGAVLLCVLAGCDPYAAWPEPETVFPWVVAPEEGVEDWQLARVETETWRPLEDLGPTGQYVRKSLELKPSASPDVLAHHEAQREALPPLVPSDLRLSFVGDVMWVGGGWSTLAEGVADLVEGDLRVGNLETPTSPDHPTGLGELGLYAYNAPPALLDSLPLDVLQLTNNHSLDAGDAGLEATQAELSARDLTGTGVDGQAVRELPGGVRVALLAYTWGMNAREALATTTHDLGVVPFGHLDADVDLGPVVAEIHAQRAAGVDLVVVLPHWGFEYELYAEPHFLRLARRMVEAGADLVVGTGPHVVQPAEVCAVNDPAVVPGVGTCSLRTADGRPRTAAILPSLGNFGASPSLARPELRAGIVASVSVTAEAGVTGLAWEAVVSLPSGEGAPLAPLADQTESPWPEEAARLDAHLGAGWKRHRP